MNYAVVRTGGKQYRLSVGDIVEVEHLATDGKKYEFTEVLLYCADGYVKIGNPTVKGALVKATIVGDIKGEKIRVSKFKAKARHRRVFGHRQSLSKVKIDEIVSGLATKTKK